MEAKEHDLNRYRITLIKWWQEGGARQYPWRLNRTYYRTAIAELMLRRTRADQVVPVYNTFLTRFPDLASAAVANEELLHQILQPLGLRWRAENIIAFLRQAFTSYGNTLPSDRNKLMELPGIGDYVSAAIVCFAGSQSAPLIDTNVVRILARLTGREYHAETRRESAMRTLASICVDPDRPAEYHYALLDFGALVCTARAPRCSSCPLNLEHLCLFARKNNLVAYTDVTDIDVTEEILHGAA